MSEPGTSESTAKNDPVRITAEALDLPAADRRSFVESRCNPWILFSYSHVEEVNPVNPTKDFYLMRRVGN